MKIYKVTNIITNKWYIGKVVKDYPAYLGSGVAIRNAIKKYGKTAFQKEILEECHSKEHLNEREKYWINLTNAVNDPMSYNLASGGEGGDLSSYVDYKKRGYKGDYFSGAKKWFNSLTDDQKKELYEKQTAHRKKVWYVSRKEPPNIEIRVENINKWSKENNCVGLVQTANKKLPLYGKSIKGWRCRHEDDLDHPPFTNKRLIGRENVACKGKSWKLIDGKRVWF